MHIEYNHTISYIYIFYYITIHIVKMLLCKYYFKKIFRIIILFEQIEIFIFIHNIYLYIYISKMYSSVLFSNTTVTKNCFIKYVSYAVIFIINLFFLSF